MKKPPTLPAADTKLTLQLTGADGSVRSLDAAHLVSIEAERIFLSVRIGLPEAVIRALNGGDDGKGAAISVGKLASLVPAKTDDDTDPMSAAEIAQFTGPLRVQAEHYVQFSGAHARQRLVVAETALKLVNAVGNAPFGTALDEEELWRQVVGITPDAKAAGGLPQSRRALRQCHQATEGDGYMLGQCLREVHDLNALPVTKRVWKGHGAGG